MGSTQFRIPPALSCVLAALGTLQLRVGGILNRVDPLVSASNLHVYIEQRAFYRWCSVWSRNSYKALSTPKLCNGPRNGEAAISISDFLWCSSEYVALQCLFH